MTIAEADIEHGLKLVVQNAPLSWPIAWPNVASPGTKPYIRFEFVKIGRRDETLAGEQTISRGRVIATVVGELGKSTVPSTQKADEIAALFPMGRRIPAGSGEIVIIKPADIREGFVQDAEWRTPVIIDYEAS